MPCVTCLLVDAASTQPVVFKVKSWTQDGSNNYTGCVIQGNRMSLLPATILTLAALVNFDVAGASASGATFCCIALMPST